MDSRCQLNSRQVRLVYLITYSQADPLIAATREDFARIVVEAFSKTNSGSSELSQWVCSKENHVDHGFHYHVAVKLTRGRRWATIRNYLQRQHDICVHFSNSHTNYFSAWRYVTKEDSSYIESNGHPDLTNQSEPRTTSATAATQSQSARRNLSRIKRPRKTRMSVYDVSQLVVAKRIKNRLQLLVLANQQKQDGKEDLAQFIANRGSKVVEDAIRVGWELEEAEEKLKRSKLTRLEILEQALENCCVENCNGQWLEMAENLIHRNGIDLLVFTTACRMLLEKGRGKYRNILLTGPANCGKTFILNPLNVVYKTFSNPASTSFAWVGAENCEIVFLNDFRWSSQILAWHDMLLLLEGQTVHLPAPKSHYAQDIVFDSDTPVFCTGKQELQYIRGQVLDERETEMMRVRWRHFMFYAQIQQNEQRNVPPCPRCFAAFILQRSTHA